jgi:hypothetical protein
VFVVQGVRAAQARAAGDSATGLRGRRSLRGLVLVEHVLLLLALASGYWLMQQQGLGPTRARWLALKLGLVAFLVVPMEAMHAFIAHGWVARGLRRTAQPPFDKELLRGLGVEEMLRALAVPLFGLGLPLILWLSFRKPF